MSGTASELGEAIARSGIKKHYYLETRGDVLLRNKEVFRFWKELGVAYMFLGLEAIDEEGSKNTASACRSAAISRLWNSPARSASMSRST